MCTHIRTHFLKIAAKEQRPTKEKKKSFETWDFTSVEIKEARFCSNCLARWSYVCPPSRATKDYSYVQCSWCIYIQGRASKQHRMEIYVWIYACVCIHTHTRLETTDVSSLFAWSLLARKWSSVCNVLWRALSGKCILPSFIPSLSSLDLLQQTARGYRLPAFVVSFLHLLLHYYGHFPKSNI